MPTTRRSAGKNEVRPVDRGSVVGVNEESTADSSASAPQVPTSVGAPVGPEGFKTVLYFPVEGVPRLVDLPRSSLRGQQYSPYVDGHGLGPVCVTFMLTAPADHYLVVYLDQIAAFQSYKNSFVTHMLEALVGPGKRRPWFGPLLVEYQRENAFTVDTMKEEVVCVIRIIEFDGRVSHLHTVYERLHKDPLVAYDALPVDTSVKAVSPREFFSTYGADVNALLE
ncbi:hypothetical protein VNI00_011318 [Paramarasmius palmivorus]|uniref:Uncharacterized protein n=1 Tax=Paramarasmius palmivorus TaxID=297713 RepID=A0AAW0CH40_9AGAR